MIVLMAYGMEQEHEAPPALETKDLSWNTHMKIRDFFGFPEDDEFFGVWLDWFYNALNQDQRRTLRNTPLGDLSPDDFPRRPVI